MSAVMGIYYSNGKIVEPQYIENMMETLSHRGSDAADIWQEPAISLGHRMLWTTPESLLEKLPLVSNNKKLVITADARIDNRQELIFLLDLSDREEDKITDSQLILEAYQKWDDRCLEKLIGDFAFAIWDRSRQLLFCARDHFGIKPFYYYHSSFAFVFASEIKGLFCVPEVPRRLNKVRIGDFLSSTLYDTKITYYQDIWRLPPAHKMIVSDRGIEMESYWSLDPDRELKLNSDREYADKFREIFTEAVRCRLRSAYPIGSMLSGGLDSSSIACMARKVLKESDRSNLHTFSSIFDKVPKSDERSFMNAVISQGEVEPHFIHGDESSPLTDIEKILWHQDEPVFAFNLHLNWKTYQLANQLGVRVILDGFDGDNTISHGIGYLKELARAGRWKKFIVEVRRFSKNFDRPFWQTFWTYFSTYSLQPLMMRAQFTKSIWYRVKSFGQKISAKFNASQADNSWDSILNPQFSEQIQLPQRRRRLLKERYGSCKTQRQEHYRAIRNGILPTTLEVLDKIAMPFNVEMRYPFWDKRLVEFCLSLPAEQKMQLGWTRMILRRGMEGVLPSEIQWRGGKGNLAHSFAYGLQAFEKNNLENILKDSTLIEDYVNIHHLTKISRDFASNSKKDQDIMAIWKAMNLFLWFKYNKKNINSKI